MTVLFYLILFLFGFNLILPLSRKVPFWLLSITAFLWGLLLWMLASLITVLLGLNFSWIVMILMVIPPTLATVVLNIRLRTYQISLKQAGILLASGLILTGVAMITSRNSYIYATNDSFNYIFHGKVLAKSGLVPWAVDRFTKLGAFSSLIQMNSQLLPVDYLSGYKTILAVILITTLSIVFYQFLRQYFFPILALIISGSLVMSMGSMIFLNHSFYIHNNLPAATLLFLSTYSFWNLIKTESQEWMILGLVSVTGFSFTRIEGPLYACLLLALVISYLPHSYRRKLELVLPYSVIALSWHIFLLLNAIDNQQLSQTNLLLIIAALLGTSFLALVSKRLPAILENLPGLLLSIMAASIILLVLIEPDHMIASITHVWQNLTNVYFWGWTWFLMLALLAIFINKTDLLPEDLLLLSYIAGYILVIILLAIFRIPYRLGETDSANRLMLQILPVIIFLIASNAETLKLWFSAPSASSD